MRFRLKQAGLALGLGVMLASAGAVNAASYDDGECELDQMMSDTRVEMDRMAIGMYENGVLDPTMDAIESAMDVKTASCLPILDQLDSLMRIRIPSMGGAMGNVMSMIRDLACDMLNSAIEGIVSDISIGYSDPLGIASIGVGTTTDGSNGTQIETYDLGEVVIDAAIGAGTDAVGNSASGLTDKLPSGPTDRSSSSSTTTIDREVRGAINGL